MKLINLDVATLATCVQDAQRERVVITRNGKPVALIVGVAGMDEEQLRLGASETFWQLIAQRRTQPTIDRAELEKELGAKPRNKPRSQKPNQRRATATPPLKPPSLSIG